MRNFVRESEAGVDAGRGLPARRRWSRSFSVLAVLAGLSAAASWGQTAPPRLTMEEAIRVALESRRELVALRATVDGGQGLVLQSGLRPNPRLTFQTENWRFSNGFDVGQDLDWFAFLSQPFETAGKRRLRAEAAGQRLRIAEARRDGLEWEIRQEIKNAYLRSLLAQREVDLLRENQAYFEQITEYHRVRVEQGAIPEADLIRVDLERERSELALQGAELVAEQAVLALFESMGSAPPGPLPKLDDPSEPAAGTAQASPADALLRQAKTGRWEAMLARAELENARAERNLEQARSRPDWDLSLGYKRTEGFNTLLAGVSVPLPFFDANQGNILFSSREVSAAEARLEAVLRRIEAETEAALAGWRKRSQMLRRLRGGMLERAEESFRISLSAYQEGASDLLRLLDARRALNDVQLLFARARIEFELSRVRLETAVGAENVRPAEESFEK